jgi:uncharacterized protein (TIGR00369 family)
MTNSRELLVRWQDPAPTNQAVGTKAGLDVLRAMQSGELPPPPVAMLIGFTFVELEKGRVVGRMVPSEAHYNPLATVHGGIIATLLDTVMGCAVHSTLDAGRGYTTLSISVNYIRPVKIATGAVVATGTIEHAGRSTAIARGTLHDANGRLLATAETTCMLFDAPR